MASFRRDGDALVWQMGHERLRIEPWGHDSLRLRATPGAEIRDDLPGALLPGQPDPNRTDIDIGQDDAAIHNGALTARVSPGGQVRFLKGPSGQELLAEASPHFARTPARHYSALAGDTFRLEARFQAYDGERLYGLGQHQHGRLDQKGCVIDLVQYNTEVTIPFLLSSRGYGFLWNNPAVGRVELAENGTRWTAEESQQLDYWITAGDTPAEVLSHYADATGHAPMLPGWAAGFWQSKLRYTSQAEVLAVAHEYRRRGLPLSVIVIDFFHWTLMGDWRFDPELWPDPAGMVQELARLGVRAAVSIWPTVNAASPNFEPMARGGLLIHNERGVPAHTHFIDRRPEGRVYLHVYDATNPEARRFIWERVREGYHRHGVTVYWLDADEPEMYPPAADNLRYHAGSGPAVANLYPLRHAQAFYDGLRAEGEEEIATLSRSAWAGSQRYGTIVWSGDVASSFAALQAQVRAGLNMALSGIPWWTTDIGGFAGGDLDSPVFRELVVRWFQYGTFCPIMRLHGYRLPQGEGGFTGGPNEVWSFGEAAYAILREFLLLRERLRPYVMAQMKGAHECGLPPMRPLFVDFPGDEACAGVDDELMLGPDLLVAPVLYEGARSRRVYLPAGSDWTDGWTGAAAQGGQWLEAEAPLERIPVYVRAGVDLPIRA
jgi:alpha-D-xyloside xylohydrolase